MDSKLKAERLIERFKRYAFAGDSHTGTYDRNEERDNARKISGICCDEIIKDLQQSLEVSKELHPHCEGLIAGSIVYWTDVKRQLSENE